MEAGGAGSPSCTGVGDIWAAGVLPTEANNPLGDDNKATNSLALQCSTLQAHSPT